MSDKEDEMEQSADLGGVVPSETRQLRACLVCSLVKTATQWRDGCENCPFLTDFIPRNQERILSCTTSAFEGLIAMMDQAESWVAKWQRIHGTFNGQQYVRGCYAISVSGRLPDDIIDQIRSAGYAYIPRDNAQ
eukprot:TRINITY_DN1715_c0_g1_i1.p1 TRINITY_DN1715_c0_g1~~TRINITY_DN1715_c0_g1_i1.p1  ORF type:complete len:134 (-),score=18.44 TRINITY_DN1715_c0_g1_i1:107-508(-)